MSAGSIKRMVLELLRQAHDFELAFIRDLPPALRDTEGSPDHWSPKDRVAQIAAWKELQTGKLATAVRGETPPRWTESAVVDPLNVATYAKYASRPWKDVLAFEDRAYAGLVAQVERLSEDDLADPRKYPAAGGALWPETLGNGIWFPFSMLADIARESGNPARIAELSTARIQAYTRMLSAAETAGLPVSQLAGMRYDLACLYAQAGQTDHALRCLADALQARPELAGHARHDSDLISLRENPTFEELTAAGSESPLSTPAFVRERQAAGAPLVVVDVRDADEYAAGHVAGAVNIPLDQLDDRLAEIPADQDVVTYCDMHHRGTSRGERASLLLRLRGRAATALDGGFPGWKAAGLPVEESH